jgi:hypothetical protein
MAFPTIDSVTVSGESGDGDGAHTVTFATAAAGDLIIVVMTPNRINGTNTWPAPWVEIKDAFMGSPNGLGVITVGYLIASGGESSVIVTTSASGDSHALGIRILKANWHGTTPPEISSGVAANNNTTNNPDAVTASWGVEDNLFIAILGLQQANPAREITAFPTGYDLNQTYTNNAVAVSGCNCAIAAKESAASSDDPGAFTWTPAGTSWVGTLVVRPSAAVLADRGAKSGFAGVNVGRLMQR